jgi:hypothetical protein
MCDGTRETIKMLERKASLQTPWEEQIMTPRKHCAAEDHSKEMIMSFQSLKPMSDKSVSTRKYVQPHTEYTCKIKIIIQTK